MTEKPSSDVETVLVTGGLGCIGAQTVRWLIAHTPHTVVATARSVDRVRAERVLGDAFTDRVVLEAADLRDYDAWLRLLQRHAVDRVMHLAALQSPDCNAHRDLGLQVNLAGTQHLIEAMKASGRSIRRFVFASSIAVYGPRAHYPAGRVPSDAAPRPVNVYGVWKLAAEHLSRCFFEEHHVDTICLRPGVLFGPGRDLGLTSKPTTAMKCVALGRPYEIPFRTQQDYQYSPDVGAACGLACTRPFTGYGVFTLPGRTATMDEMAAAIRNAADELSLPYHVTIGSEETPFICELDYDPFLKAFPDAPRTQLDAAVRQSIVAFREHVERGWLTPDSIS